jgi:hypothetical protein
VKGFVTSFGVCGHSPRRQRLVMTKISHSGYRFPAEIIQQAIWLYLCFTLSRHGTGIDVADGRTIERKSRISQPRRRERKMQRFQSVGWCNIHCPGSSLQQIQHPASSHLSQDAPCASESRLCRRGVKLCPEGSGHGLLQELRRLPHLRSLVNRLPRISQSCERLRCFAHADGAMSR